MTDQPYYPEINQSYLTPLEVIAEQIDLYPEYLGPKCPYSKEMKALLIRFRTSSGSSNTRANFFGRTGDKWQALLDEILNLYQELNDFGANLSTEDTAETMSYLRTKTSLIQKIVEMSERALGLKRLSEFQNTMMDIMENVLDLDQRTQVMDRLRASIGEDA